MKDGWLRRRIVWYLKRREVFEAHKGREGSCARCGACCSGCPFHDDKARACKVYRMRPDICRMFPLTPHDIRNVKTCGFRFKKDEDDQEEGID